MLVSVVPTSRVYRSCWRMWRTSMSEPRRRCQMRCQIPPSCRHCWTWAAAWTWSCQSFRDSNKSCSRPAGSMRWAQNVFVWFKGIVVVRRHVTQCPPHVPGARHAGRAPPGHSGADEEADRLWRGSGSPPRCGEGDGRTARDPHCLGEMGG